MLTYGNLVITLIVAMVIAIRNIITVTLPNISYTIVSRNREKQEKLEKKEIAIKEYVKLSSKIRKKENDK